MKRPLESQKPLFTISVAANLVKVHPRTLMLYEKKGLVKPFRTSRGRRLYSPNEIKFLGFIRFLTQEKRINLNGVQVLLEAIDAAKKEKVDLKKLLFPEYKEVHIFE